MRDIPEPELMQARARLWEAVKGADAQIDLWRAAQNRWKFRVRAISGEIQRRIEERAAAVEMPREAHRERLRTLGRANARKRWRTEKAKREQELLETT